MTKIKRIILALAIYLFFLGTSVTLAQEMYIGFCIFSDSSEDIITKLSLYDIPHEGLFGIFEQEKFPQIVNILQTNYVENERTGTSTALIDTVKAKINALLNETYPEHIREVIVVVVTDGEDTVYKNSARNRELTQIRELIQRASTAPVSIRMLIIEARKSDRDYDNPNRSGLDVLRALSVNNGEVFYQLRDLDKQESALNDMLNSLAAENNGVYWIFDNSRSLDIPLKKKISSAVETAVRRLFSGIRNESGLVFVPGIKRFRIGDDRYGDSYPAHFVDEINDFYMSPSPITVREFLQVMGIQTARYRPSDLDKPVTVSFFEAAEFCNRKSRMEGKTPVYTIEDGFIQINRSANGYRMPYEWEWEYAATGTVLSREYAVYDARELPPVESVLPNAKGLFMYSGVREWCSDFNIPYAADGTEAIAYQPVSGHEMITRGTAFMEPYENLRGTRRSYNRPDFSDNGYIGFRIACSAN